MGWEITEIMFPVRVVFTECYLLVMILVSHIILSLKFQKKISRNNDPFSEEANQGILGKQKLDLQKFKSHH